MTGSQFQRNSGVLWVIAVMAIGSAAFQAAPGGASERRQVPEFQLAQAQARKDGPKALQPAASPAPAGTKAPPASEVCDAKARKLDDIAASLNKSPPQSQKSCATTASPARIKLAGAINRAILVRPLNGDIDAFLSRNDEIIDVSMNRNRRAELILLPASGEFELIVSAESPTATFEISAVQIASPDQKQTQSDRPAPQQPKTAPGQASAQQAATEKANAAQTQSIPDWVPAAFRNLGYDLIDPADSNDESNNPVDLRAIMAFQAGERFQITGKLRPEQIRYLANLAAIQMDVAAQDAVKTMRQVSQNSPVVTFPEPAEDQADVKDKTTKKDEPEDSTSQSFGLKSMKGAFYDGRFFGEGELRSGVKFKGEWLDGPTAGDSQRPGLGVLYLANDCQAAIKTFTMPDAFTESEIIAHSIGVVRQKDKKLFTGDLSQAANEIQSCLPDPSAG
jgi:hypothetical protein